MKAAIKQIFFCGILILHLPGLFAQNADSARKEGVYGIIQGSDTIPMLVIPEVQVYHLHQYDYLFLKRKYRRLIYNVKKAYPYAKMAGLKLRILDEQLSKLETEKERKQHLEMAEKEIMDKFEKDIKRLTITQGIILVKLIDRETGRTSYNVIKDLKGGFTAFFWQGIARLFGNNLKLQYDPLGEDKVMEDIVQGIEAGFI